MIAYFDCFSGISGDMTLAALIDLGVPVDWLKNTLAEKLPLQGFDLEAQTVDCSGISARQVSVIARDDAERDYRAISGLISESALPASVIETALAMFDRLAEAEAKIHGCAKQDVHFHEVGGVDSIVDMVGAALAVDYLGIDEVVASPLPLGSGSVECRHGTLPVPAPATAALLEGVPVYGSDIPFELVTPTGAAIITTLAKSFDNLPDMILAKTGYGAGSRKHSGGPNVLRVITGRNRTGVSDSMMLVETCIDDMNPEIYGYLTDRLFADGAKDVYMIPVYMKKGRPGTMVQVLCEKARKDDIASRILTETSAIGVRYWPVQRRVLERCVVTVETTFGPVAAKQVCTPDGDTRIAPEYESCRRIAEEQDIALQSVYRAAVCGKVEPESQNIR
ncbi:MAG: nickel pincer cofactor biosynthesis protein LarC [Desulfobacteraceae bacterium]|nr:nickel pincer cofactor biosynthesis protein LarC [Desulfobacteraceae bacterium]